MSSKNKQVVNRINDAFAQNNVEGFLSYCTDEVSWTMVGEKSVKGKDAIRQWMGSMPAEPPHFTVAQVIAEGDFVTAFGDMTMKDKDGSATPYSYCDIYRFRGDKIAELTSYVIKTEAAKEQTSGKPASAQV
jgi:ketosteroid isomerase-like protein